MTEGSGEYHMKAETGAFAVKGADAELSWKSLRGAKFSSVEPPSDWPRGVQPISLEGTSLFGIDRNTGELYWDGKQIVTSEELRLTPRQEYGAKVLLAAAVVTAIAAVVFGVLSATYAHRQATYAAKTYKLERAKAIKVERLP